MNNLFYAVLELFFRSFIVIGVIYFCAWIGMLIFGEDIQFPLPLTLACGIAGYLLSNVIVNKLRKR